MKVKGLDGREYNWPMKSSPKAKCSKGHQRARELLARLFPLEPRLEEVPLPGSRRLRADFYLPVSKLLVEVQGRQHGEFVGHFHGHGSGFLNAMGRDSRKRDWCELNEITYLELPDSEDDAAWRKRILSA